MSDPTPPTPGNDAPASGPQPEAEGSPASAFARKSYALATTRGFGNATGRGFEMAATLVVMVGIGWLLDRAFGTEPLMIIVLSVLGFVGTGIKLWLGYDLEMQAHEKDAIWNRHKGAAS